MKVMALAATLSRLMVLSVPTAISLILCDGVSLAVPSADNASDDKSRSAEESRSVWRPGVCPRWLEVAVFGGFPLWTYDDSDRWADVDGGWIAGARTRVWYRYYGFGVTGKTVRGYRRHASRWAGTEYVVDSHYEFSGSVHLRWPGKYLQPMIGVGYEIMYFWSSFVNYSFIGHHVFADIGLNVPVGRGVFLTTEARLFQKDTMFTVLDWKPTKTYHRLTFGIGYGI